VTDKREDPNGEPNLHVAVGLVDVITAPSAVEDGAETVVEHACGSLAIEDVREPPADVSAVLALAPE